MDETRKYEIPSGEFPMPLNRIQVVLCQPVLDGWPPCLLMTLIFTINLCV